ncbi:MAG: pro-sigmaK processing inhibitor BofA family protein [Bacilli bacterium]|nr:pro-sigmaK processing inhibitor BofA family protein [Bacilli bacterium]
MFKLKKVMMNLIFAFVSLYTVNLFTVNFDIMVPISILGLIIISFLGLPGLITYCLIVIKYL